MTQIDQLRRAATRLPIAAALAVLLAMRPRRKGTPHRRAAVIQTQVILAIIGAVVMLVVGASLARAFGIVGAAGLVRYRAKIDDPKDAGVMLSTLAIGLASGVGLWMLAVFTTVFIMLVLGIIESFEPKGTRAFSLEIKAKEPEKFKPKVEEILTRAKLEHTLRTASDEEICYEVNVPLDRKTDRLTEAILKLDPENVTAVEWKEPKRQEMTQPASGAQRKPRNGDVARGLAGNASRPKKPRTAGAPLPRLRRCRRRRPAPTTAAAPAHRGAGTGRGPALRCSRASSEPPDHASRQPVGRRRTQIVAGGRDEHRPEHVPLASNEKAKRYFRGKR